MIRLISREIYENGKRPEPALAIFLFLKREIVPINEK